MLVSGNRQPQIKLLRGLSKHITDSGYTAILPPASFTLFFVFGAGGEKHAILGMLEMKVSLMKNEDFGSE